MPEYRVVVHDLVHKGGTKIAEVFVKNLIYSKILNAPGAISFILPIHHEKCTFEIFKPGARELRVYKDDELQWGGYLWTAFREGSEDDVTGGIVHMRFGGMGWGSRFKKRRLAHDKDYISEDVFDIAWDYINYTQQRLHGNLGITRFSTAKRGEVQTLHPKAHQRKTIEELIHEVAESDQGFDFEVTPQKQWKVYERQGNTVPKVFELGKDKKNNVKNYTFNTDAITSMANDLTVAGKGQDDLKLMSNLVDATSLYEYGLLEGLETRGDVEDQAVLDSIAALFLRFHKQPRRDITTYVTVGDPPDGTYSVGDTMRVRIDDGYSQINDLLRVKTIVHTIPNVGDPTISIFYDEEHV